MCYAEKKKFYSPQFSELACVTVRRLSWAMGMSMPEAVNVMAKIIPCYVNCQKICMVCTDKTKCHTCSFSQEKQNSNFLSLQFSQREQDALMSVQ
jgi:hypothetical protein